MSAVSAGTRSSPQQNKTQWNRRESHRSKSCTRPLCLCHRPASDEETCRMRLRWYLCLSAFSLGLVTCNQLTPLLPTYVHYLYFFGFFYVYFLFYLFFVEYEKASHRRVRLELNPQAISYQISKKFRYTVFLSLSHSIKIRH
ncbi:hypothetical protein HDV63DRAFT_332089 [Trichoderma sp. SZMC 28014]